MNKTFRKIFAYGFIVIALSFVLSTLKLPFYIYQPGSADPLTDMVEVKGGTKSEGVMHLVTVSGGQATPIRYLLAKILPHHEIRPIDEVRTKGWSDEEYWHAQLQMMESAQMSSTVVAYEAAGEEIEIEYDGVYVVSTVEDMPADGKLKMGDRIIQVDTQEVKESADLMNYVSAKAAGDTIKVTYIRDEKEENTEITLEKFANEDKVGMGIQLVTNRKVTVEPEVEFSSGNIGGPSAGLIFALEIYDQLMEEDLTRGYKIVATGELDFDGNVLAIGGVDKKVVAADKAGADIFIVPNENGRKNSNYEIAKAKAKEIKTDLEIIPVDTFSEAVEYLESLPEK